MFSASHLARLLATLPLALLVHAQNYNITISEVEIFPCPFKIQVSAASNLSYIDIVYSTKGTTPNSLASYGDSKSSNKRRCYTNTLIRHPELFARARPLRMEMSGSVKLEAGLTAKIETGLVWSTMQSMVGEKMHNLRYSGHPLTSSSLDKLLNRAILRPNRFNIHSSRHHNKPRPRRLVPIFHRRPQKRAEDVGRILGAPSHKLLYHIRGRCWDRNNRGGGRLNSSHLPGVVGRLWELEAVV